jgi:DNA-binding transcriptional regulator YiaG
MTLPEPWKTYALKAGGLNELAARLGAAPRSVRQWALGQRRMNGASKLLLEMFVKEHHPS